MKRSKSFFLAGGALLLALGILYLGLLLSPSSLWHLKDVTGHLPDLEFSLTSDTGQDVSEKNYKGEIVLLYFGYAGCSTQCPLTLSQLTHVIEQLGDTGQSVHILFVSIDPIHDAPQSLHHFISAFDARHITGLTGSPEEVADFAKRYRVAYRPYWQGEASERPHTDTVYVFDASGHARLLYTVKDTKEALIEDIKTLAAGTPKP